MKDINNHWQVIPENKGIYLIPSGLQMEFIECPPGVHRIIIKINNIS